MQADVGSPEIIRKCQDDTRPFAICLKNSEGNSSNRMPLAVSLY